MVKSTKVWTVPLGEQVNKTIPPAKLTVAMLISKIFGIFPFNELSELSTFWFVEAIVIRIIELIMVSISFYFCIQLIIQDRVKTLYLLLFVNTCTLFTTNLHLVSFYRNRKKWQIIVYSNKSHYHRKSDIYFYIDLIRIIIQFLINFSLFRLNKHYDFLTIRMCLHYAGFIDSIIINNFCGKLEILTKQMRTIDREIIKAKYFKVIIPTKLKQLAKRQNYLIDLAQNINNIFAIQNLIIYSRSIIGFICVTYEVIRISATLNIQSKQSFTSGVLEVLSYFGNILSTVYFCEQFSEEVSKTVYSIS